MKIGSKILLEKEFCKEMDIFLQFKRLLHGQYYFSVIVVHARLRKHWLKQPQNRRLVASI